MASLLPKPKPNNTFLPRIEILGYQYFTALRSSEVNVFRMNNLYGAVGGRSSGLAVGCGEKYCCVLGPDSSGLVLLGLAKRTKKKEYILW